MDGLIESNGISKQHVHLLAAKLNVENGAHVPANVFDAITRSDEILADYNESDWQNIKKGPNKELKKEIEELKDLLDRFNNGEFDDVDCIEDWWKEE